MATFRSRSLRKFFLLWSLRFVYVTRQHFDLECAMKTTWYEKRESVSCPYLVRRQNFEITSHLPFVLWVTWGLEHFSCHFLLDINKDTSLLEWPTIRFYKKKFMKISKKIIILACKLITYSMSLICFLAACLMYLQLWIRYTTIMWWRVYFVVLYFLLPIMPAGVDSGAHQKE